MTTAAKIAERRQNRPEDAAVLDDGVRRYKDTRFDAVAVKVFPGERYVTRDPREMLVTVLGSCVSACIRDPLAGIGGMNHFMLPESADGQWGTASANLRYGNFAMEQLINDLLKAGGRKERLEIKVFGGGNVLAGNTAIGDRNADFVEAYLAAEHLPIAAKHLRGRYPRRVHYFPATGKVMMMELRRQQDTVALGAEETYRSRLRSAPDVSGSAELF